MGSESFVLFRGIACDNTNKSIVIKFRENAKIIAIINHISGIF